MPIEYSISENTLQEYLDEMVSDMSLAEFAPLRDNKIKVLACTKVKVQEEEEQPCSGDPVSVKKVSDLHRVFIDGHYIVVVDHYTFNHLNDLQLKALLHSALMHISVETTESGIKLGTRKPDIRVFQATINRFGAYTDALLGLRECLIAAGKRFADMVTTESTEAGVGGVVDVDIVPEPSQSYADTMLRPLAGNENEAPVTPPETKKRSRSKKGE
jgi:hypothetical protein